MPANVDVSRAIEDLEQILRAPDRSGSHADALAVLRRWQFDPDLDEASRLRARQLVHGHRGRLARPAATRRVHWN